MKRTTISMLLAAPVLALVMGGCSMESASAASDTAVHDAENLGPGRYREIMVELK